MNLFILKIDVSSINYQLELSKIDNFDILWSVIGYKVEFSPNYPGITELPQIHQITQKFTTFPLKSI